jgi:pilus assembly protein FimV
MDFGLPASTPAPAMLELPAVSAPEPVRLDAPDMTLNENSLNFDVAPPPPAPAPKAAPAAAPAAANRGMIEFDLGALSLDLPGNAPAPAAAAPKAPAVDLDATMAAGSLDLGGADATADSPLATKLALAEEFNAIGDADGARSLAEEVVAEASGDLKSRAQRLLAEIG